MRWFVLFVGLLVSFPSLAIAGEEDWIWIITCEVFSEKQQENVEVYRETFDVMPQFFNGASGFTNGISWGTSGKIFYIGWGDRSCTIMDRKTHENRR